VPEIGGSPSKLIVLVITPRRTSLLLNESLIYTLGLGAPMIDSSRCANIPSLLRRRACVCTSRCAFVLVLITQAHNRSSDLLAASPVRTTPRERPDREIRPGVERRMCRIRDVPFLFGNGERFYRREIFQTTPPPTSPTYDDVLRGERHNACFLPLRPLQTTLLQFRHDEIWRESTK
jgi:hypothetical protein